MSTTSDRIHNLLKRLKKENDDDLDHGEQLISPPDTNQKKIKTLNNDVYRPLSPMLMARFNYCGKWTNANLEQDWLSISEIDAWEHNDRLKKWIDLRIENWDHCPPANTKKENCAIFGYNPYDPEETYLVWDDDEEPKIWRFVGADYKVFNTIERFFMYLIGDLLTDDSIKQTI
jgi:hypothetical protein